MVERVGRGVAVRVVVVVGVRVDDLLVEVGGWGVTLCVVVVGRRECIEGPVLLSAVDPIVLSFRVV
jgi:hypothetical protein